MLEGTKKKYRTPQHVVLEEICFCPTGSSWFNLAYLGKEHSRMIHSCELTSIFMMLALTFRGVGVLGWGFLLFFGVICLFVGFSWWGVVWGFFCLWGGFLVVFLLFWCSFGFFFFCLGIFGCGIFCWLGVFWVFVVVVDFMKEIILFLGLRPSLRSKVPHAVLT